VKAGQAAAIERLYREHGDLVLRRARRLMGSEPDAQEILQELFMSFMRRPEQLEGQRSPTAWLYAATTHLCLNTLRNRNNRVRLLQREGAAAAGGALAVAGDPESVLGAQQLVASLPEELAQVAVYYYLDEMTHDEIAEVIGCSRRQVGNLLQKVQHKLQRRA
jgi:RNA polymerase sigma-70 factor (ECF subfamily)